MKLYCATGNPGKLREFRVASLRAGIEPDSLVPLEIELLPGFRQIAPCVEDGATFEANAVKKALHYGSFAPGLLFADDSGLNVDALGGAPGVLSARFAGPHTTDAENNRLLLEKMRGEARRNARFVCAIALVEVRRVLGVYRGSVEGVILDSPRGADGFGYDPLFYYPPLGRSFGELSAEEKIGVSHRGQAMRAMLEALPEMLTSRPEKP